MPSQRFSLHATHDESDAVKSAIVAPLSAYNTAKAGPGNSKPMVLELRDDAGAVVGGLWGSTGRGWLFTQFLVVPEALRGQGLGKQLMAQAEAEALARGCTGAWLDTFEFQARPFYESIGYECFGQIDDYPAGFARFFMKKRLIPLNSPG